MINVLWNTIVSSDVLNEEIKQDACVLTKACGDTDDAIEIHCWDGRRYDLTLTRLPDGCKYDLLTGKPIVEEGKPQIRTERDAMIAMVEAMTAALNDRS